MQDTVEKSIYQIVGNPICIEAEDGKKVSNIILEFLKHDQHVTLSFINVEILTSAYLNTAIGILYQDYPEDKIKALISVKDIRAADAVLLKRVIDTAKNYYKNPAMIEKSVQDILENE